MGKGIRVGAYIAVAVLSILLFKTCGDMNEAVRNNSINVDSVRYYKSKSGAAIAYNDVMTTKFKDLEKYNAELKDEIKDMKIKNPEVVIHSTTKTIIDTIYIAFHDTLPCDDFIQDIVLDSLWYDIDMTLTKESLTINEIMIPNKQTIVVGEKKNGIFKRNEYIVAVKNDNPHIQTDTLETYSFKKDKKFFERPSVNITIGVALGVILKILFDK